MDNFSIKRVIWRDGDIITESHFIEHERWLESLFGLSTFSDLKYGLFRNILFQDYYNKSINISFHHIEAAQYRVDIEYIQGINQYGKIIKIDDKREFKLNVEFSKSDEKGKILVYLLPKKIDQYNNDEIDRISDEIETGTRLYDDQYVLSTTNSNNAGIPIMRFINKGNNLDIDENFIPFGLYLNSSHSCMMRHGLFAAEYDRYISLLYEYIQKNGTGINPLVWTTVTELFRTLKEYESHLKDTTISSISFIRLLANLFNKISAELDLFAITNRGEYLQQKSKDVMLLLSEPVAVIVEQQFDLDYTYNQAIKNLKKLILFLEDLPQGQDTEREIPIGDVIISKVASWNKLLLIFDKKVDFKKGESILTFKLRSFTRAEPNHRTIRAGLGDVSPAHLMDFINVIQPMKDEKHSYIIECPKEAVDKTESDRVTIFLPPPLGEGVPDLRSNIKVTVRSVSNV